ncbi:MAG: hypothetical protein J0L62_06640 [Bacteroidetes bacterium]|nr:hypothetical protein [Bacteroidota bacterium]
MNRLTISAASLVFATAAFAQGTTTIGGYGELHFNKPTVTPGKISSSAREGVLDFHRFVLFAGHNFNDWISFKSELEIEHTLLEDSNDGSGSGAPGELALEQAYIDLAFRKEIGVRAGILMVPVGIINEEHEPSTFHGVERPNVDRYIIPSTWRESGAGVYGQLGDGFKYRAYVMAGLKPEGISKNGIRSSRQEAAESSTKTVAFTGKLEYVPTLDIKTGVSFFTSSLGDSRFTMGEADVQYNSGSLFLRNVVVYSFISDVKKLNALYGNNAGDSQFGFYSEAAYDILPLITESEQKWFFFGRFEKYNVQNTVDSSDPNSSFVGGLNKSEWVLGTTWKPIENVAIKADYQFITPDGAKESAQHLNVGFGYFFY